MKKITLLLTLVLSCCALSQAQVQQIKYFSDMDAGEKSAYMQGRLDFAYQNYTLTPKQKEAVLEVRNFITPEFYGVTDNSIKSETGQRLEALMGRVKPLFTADQWGIFRVPSQMNKCMAGQTEGGGVPTCSCNIGSVCDCYSGYTCKWGSGGCNGTNGCGCLGWFSCGGMCYLNEPKKSGAKP